MRYAKHRQRFVRWTLLPVLMLMAGLLLPTLFTSDAAAAPAACPAAPADLPDTVERDKFCVYYTTDSVTDDQATWAADTVEEYWDRFVDLGFNEPKYSGKLEVRLSDITGTCNGATGWGINYLTTYAGCFIDAEAPDYETAQKVLGHELTHRVQYNYDTSGGAPVQTKMLKEGTARATEDNWFANIDNWPNALTSSSSFNRQVNTYLLSTNADITSYAMRYNSALWWKYASEQFSTETTEPQRGIDFFEELYSANTAGQSGIAAINSTLSAKGAGMDFDDAFKRFAVANWTKDLAGSPDGSYNYIDEDDAGNPAAYGPVVPTAGGTIEVGTDATFNDQSITRYGIRYFQADIGANCPVVTASFHQDPASDGPAFYEVVTQKPGAPEDSLAKHVRGSGLDWSQSFLNDGINKITAIVGSLDSSSPAVDVDLTCADPVIDIRMPNNGAKAYTQSLAKVLVQVQVTNGAADAPVVSGLSVGDFKAEINGVPALVTTGGFIQEQYWLLVQAPNLADGTYDLHIALEEPGTANEIAADTEVGSVQYTSEHLDHVVVIDRSGSMQSDGKMTAAKDAANFYVDMTRNDDGLSVVPYHHNVDPAPFDMQDVNAGVRSDAKTYVGGLSPSGATSIGDGLDEAVNQRNNVSTTGNPNCSFVLLSDGMENSSLFWSDVQADVEATDCPVTTIAFGQSSDETLMEEIATETGGDFFFNDVFVSSARSTAATANLTTLELGNTFEYAQGQNQGRQRLDDQNGEIPFSTEMTYTHTIVVDDSVTEALFTLNWPGDYRLSMRLIGPDGTEIGPDQYAFYDTGYGHLGYRVPNPAAGNWTAVVSRQIQTPPQIEGVEENAPRAGSQQGGIPYQLIASGDSPLTVELLLPATLGGSYFTGNRLPIFALVSSDSPLLNANVMAIVTAPNGEETPVPLVDDGLHGDGAANDGIYGGVYTRVNRADEVAPEKEDNAETTPPVKDQAGYQVRVNVNKDAVQRQARGSFAVLEGEDTNINDIPDPWETEHGVVNAVEDPDLDMLMNEDEYLEGTDPLNSDTDGGGEADGSEQRHGQMTLDPSDDQIEAPDFFQVEAANSAVVLNYDVKDEYNRMFVYRSENADGPFNIHIAELPLTGVYTDTEADNNQTYYYKLGAVDVDDHWSAILDSEAVTPRLDPVPPLAIVIIDSGALTTTDLSVNLTFTAYEDATEDFEDITEMLLSNDPTFPDAIWQPFEQGVAWQLASTEPGEEAQVYARFRDDAGNESVGTEMDSITVVEETEPDPDPDPEPEEIDLYLPYTTK